MKEAAEIAASKTSERDAGKKATDTQKELKRIQEQIQQDADKARREAAEAQKKFVEMKKKAEEAIKDMAADKEQQERWARWMIRHSIQSVEAAGGAVVVLDHPANGQYTHIRNVHSGPRKELGPKPSSFTFFPLDQAALGAYVAVCRRAGVNVAAESVVCMVLPAAFEAKLQKAELAEAKKRGADETKIKSTLFDLAEDGTISVMDMKLSK